MPKYVAFLRAVNVGGRTVKMTRLRSLLETLGLSRVETFIASGNVIFDSTSRNPAGLERKIEDCLRAALGYEVTTFVRSTSELARIAGRRPFPDSELGIPGVALYIAFLARRPAAAASRMLLSSATDVDDFHVAGREAYWLCRKKMSESKFSGSHLEKILGMPATLRNATTIRKLAARYP